MKKITKLMLTFALLVAGVGGVTSVKAETEFEFDAFGKGVVSKSELTATGGLTYNSSTGVLTSDGTAGTMVLEFETPVDLSYLIHYEVKREGTSDIISRLKFYDEDESLINTWNSIKLDNNWQMPGGIDNNATNAFLNHKPVKKMVWESDANASNKDKTLTVTSIEFTLKTIACAKAGETQLNTLPWNKIDGSGTETPNWNMNGSSDTYYGNYSGDPTHYADLTDYDELRVYCKDNNTGFRCFFINEAGNGIVQINTAYSTWNSEKKYYSLDLSTIVKWNDKVALKAIKAENGGGPGERYVTNIVAFKTPASNAPQYILTGSGMQLAETVAALADETVTSIDATGVTGITTNSVEGRTLLESANPNCLFVANAGKLSNTNNVIVDGTCANLELVDGKPFKAPAAFTATAAKFTKPVGEAGYATMVIPFAAALPTGVKAYNLTGVAGESITYSSAETIAAHSPVMIKAAPNDYEFTASNVSIAATADGVVTNGLLNGTYATTTAAADAANYVLQNNANGVNFYLVKGTPATVKPFRAYLTAPTNARALSFDFNTTGVNHVKVNSENAEVYSLSGQRVAAPQKGLYIVNGKKVIVK